MVSILKDIYTDTTLGPLLGFKGGTAALLFYGLPRFSVDLDFDLLNTEKEDAVFARLSTLLATHGTVRDAQKKHFTLYFELSYETNGRIIKVEISRRMPTLASKYARQNYMGTAMNVMAREDMVANKLLAMHERMQRAKRDIFDVWYFLSEAWDVNVPLVEDRSQMKFPEFLASCIFKLENLSDSALLAGLGELVTEKQKQWVKTKMKSEAIFLLKNYSAALVRS